MLGTTAAESPDQQGRPSSTALSVKWTLMTCCHTKSERAELIKRVAPILVPSL